MKKSIVVVFFTASLTLVASAVTANAGSWCDAAQEQSGGQSNGENPYTSGDAGATLGNVLAQGVFCLFDW
ncbi:hypothetical protein ACWF50_23870 [Brucella pseudogrignonensis]